MRILCDSPYDRLKAIFEHLTITFQTMTPVPVNFHRFNKFRLCFTHLSDCNPNVQSLAIAIGLSSDFSVNNMLQSANSDFSVNN